MIAKGDVGFTVAELLVAMTLGLIVLATIYAFFASSLRIFALQSQTAETQQNLRLGLELIAEDIQATGGTGIPAAAAITITNSSTAPDSLSLLIPNSTICPPPEPQVIPIVTYNGNAANMFLASGSTCTQMVGDVAIAVDSTGVNYRTLQITQVTTTNDKINFSPGLSPLNSPGGLGADYTGGTLVLLRRVTWSVNLTNAAKPVLQRDSYDGSGPQVVANYIEDMQISAGYDRNSDGILTEIGAAANDDEWVFNVAGESNAGEDPMTLRALRVVLIGRNKFPDPQFQGSRPAALDRPAGAIDHYHRQMRSTKVKIRNFGA